MAAQSLGDRVIDGARVDAGYEQLAVTGATPPAKCPAALTGETYGATAALIIVETNAVRWRADGTAPTAAVGNPINAGDPPFFYVGDPSKLVFIAQSGSAVVNLNYYK